MIVEREVEIAGSRKALRLTRDAALNLLLLCEQERYKEGSAIVHGYTDEVLGQLREFVGGEVMEFGYWMRDWLSRSGLAEVFEAREGVPFFRRRRIIGRGWRVYRTARNPCWIACRR